MHLTHGYVETLGILHRCSKFPPVFLSIYVASWALCARCANEFAGTLRLMTAVKLRQRHACKNPRESAKMIKIPPPVFDHLRDKLGALGASEAVCL